MSSPASPLAGQQAVGSPVASGSNGAVQAIPVGDSSQDSFYKRYMTAGPLPADQVLM